MAYRKIPLSRYTPSCTIVYPQAGAKVADVCQKSAVSPSVERYISVATKSYRTITSTIVSPGIHREIRSLVAAA
jgi:hypothetical protein